MLKKIIFIFCGLIEGILIGFIINSIYLTIPFQHKLVSPLSSQKKVIGFLPYWLIGKAEDDYSKYISELTYFGLTIDTDGSILKISNEQESEPGWNNLNSGNLDQFFQDAQNHQVELSLLVFCADNDSINSLLEDPKSHAQKLLSDVIPIMHKYGFSDLNLDIESSQTASDASRLKLVQFVQELKKGLENDHSITLTVEISPDDLIHKKLLDPVRIGALADRIVLMSYDYHFANSIVTGPIGPLSGAGEDAEYDVVTAVGILRQIIPVKKIILGVPLYGYAWETIDSTPKSAVIPGTGAFASEVYVNNLLASCSNCIVKQDIEAQERFVAYKDADIGTYHQIYSPDIQSMHSKVSLADQEQLGGIALWALGYEDISTLGPLTQFKQ